MKTFLHLKYCLLVLLFAVAITAVQSQNLIPEDGTVKHNDALRECLVVHVDPEPKTLKKAWKKYMKKNYDIKVDGIGWFQNKHLLTAENVTIEKISDKSMDLYAQVVEDDNGSEIKVFAAFGYDIYINKIRMFQEYNSLKQLLKSFLSVYIPEYYQNKINDTEKRIKQLERYKKKLNRNISKKEKKIDELESEIVNHKSELEINKNELIETLSKLSKREEKLKRVKNQLNQK